MSLGKHFLNCWELQKQESQSSKCLWSQPEDYHLSALLFSEFDVQESLLSRILMQFPIFTTVDNMIVALKYHKYLVSVLSSNTKCIPNYLCDFGEMTFFFWASVLQTVKWGSRYPLPSQDYCEDWMK